MEKIGMCGLSIYKPFGKKGGQFRLSDRKPVNRGVVGGLPALRQVILVQQIMIHRQFNDSMCLCLALCMHP
jgi:hypothetical protein